MDDLLGGLFLALAFAAPITGYYIAARDPRSTRWRIVCGSTLGGLTVALLLLACALAQQDRAALMQSAFPYAIGCIVIGAVIGAAGLAARQFGTWLSRHHDA